MRPRRDGDRVLRLLFLCPQSAGKSVLAATFTRAAAARRGLAVAVDVAGTDPVDAVKPVVREALDAQGLRTDLVPQRLDVAVAAAADLVISMGCDTGVVPRDRHVVAWQVPPLSVDLRATMTAIHTRAEALVAVLAGDDPA